MYQKYRNPTFQNPWNTGAFEVRVGQYPTEPRQIRHRPEKYGMRQNVSRVITTIANTSK